SECAIWANYHQRLGGSAMRLPAIALALTIVAACAGTAFAQQPLTRADCDKAGMKWHDSANVCGGGEAAAAAAAGGAAKAMPEKEKREKGGKKVVVKKVKKSDGTTVTTRKKVTGGHHHHHHGKKEQKASKEQKRGFFQWLKGKNKNKPS